MTGRRLTRLRISLLTFGLAGVMFGCGGDDDPGGSDAAVSTDASTTPDAAPACRNDRLDWGSGGELMLPGTDCLSCHRAGGVASSSVFTIAGSVFKTVDCPDGIAGVIVHVTDALDQTLDLETNAIGNFHTTTALTPPYAVSIEISGTTTEMAGATSTGACNSCHAAGGSPGFISP